ncbi:HD family phosphohydrolase [Deltaproteobacteria bacterium]|nr:HD family phosphohydrolase [Deltaproteobacteria bacterium]
MLGRETTASMNDAPNVEVALMPANSPFGGLVARIAAGLGAVMVRPDLVLSAETTVRVVIVDLTRVTTPARLNHRCIVISDDTAFTAWDVIPPDEVEARLARAMRNLVETELLRARAEGERETITVLNQIGYALSAITDRSRLLDELLTHSRRALRADGASIYLIDEAMVGSDATLGGARVGRTMRFAAAQNDSVPFFPPRATIPVDDASLVGFVANRALPMNIADVRALPTDVPYKPSGTFDKTTGYETRSTLLVPLMDRDCRVIGVLLFVNHKPVAGIPLANFGRVSPFSERHLALARSVASQAAVALENYRLYREITTLFDGFVEAAVTAIEARDPSTGGHSHRVAQLTEILARTISDADDPPFAPVRFSQRELTELHYAALLHDFGKVGVREEVLLKAARLYPWELAQIEQRFRVAALQAQLEAIRENAAAGMLPTRLGQLQDDLTLVRRLNRLGRVGDPEAGAIKSVAERWKLSETEPVLHPREVRRLCIPVGTLDPEERLEIERHVEHTYRFLRVIPWTRELRNVPTLAYAHHEKIDGTGYPRRLRGEAIPYGARLMTIADIFDALTAGDRPYKGAMSPEKAVQILRTEAAGGKVMHDAVELLAGRRLWTQIVEPNV